jgi:hypothetical protein
MNPDVPQRSGAQADRARYILACAEKERDELAYRIAHAAPNDAIRFTGPSMLARFEGKIADARKIVEGE